MLLPLNYCFIMNKKFRFVVLLFASLMMVGTMMSCSDDDNNKDIETAITVSNLPQKAQTFITDYYPTAKVLSVTKELDHGVVLYDVDFTDGQEIVFNADGEWVEVDAPDGHSIPSGIIPSAIEEYLNTNYQNYGVNDITRTADGYEVELVSGVDMFFDAQGDFIRFDN